MKIYKLYANNRKKGFESIGIYKDKDEAIKVALNLDFRDYSNWLLKASDSILGDDIVDMQQCTEECTLEYSDDVKPKFEVKTAIFKPSKMKRKQEERKMFEQYIDR